MTTQPVWADFMSFVSRRRKNPLVHIRLGESFLPKWSVKGYCGNEMINATVEQSGETLNDLNDTGRQWCEKCVKEYKKNWLRNV